MYRKPEGCLRMVNVPGLSVYTVVRRQEREQEDRSLREEQGTNICGYKHNTD